MLRISKLTDYALLIVSHMAKQYGLIMSAKMLAEELHLPNPTVSKILKILAEGGLVDSIRGAEGGYLLAKIPSNITLADIITIMEGKFAITQCCEKVSVCEIDSICHLRNQWQNINQVIYRLLSTLTIVDMNEPLTISGLLK